MYNVLGTVIFGLGEGIQPTLRFLPKGLSAKGLKPCHEEVTCVVSAWSRLSRGSAATVCATVALGVQLCLKPLCDVKEGMPLNPLSRDWWLRPQLVEERVAYMARPLLFLNFSKSPPQNAWHLARAFPRLSMPSAAQ